MKSAPSIAVVRIDAPAKLNLCLEVLGKSEDGFHRLRTLMATIGLRDTLLLTNGGDRELRLRVVGEPPLAAGIPTDSSNLVLRALDALRKEAGCELGADVTLVKRIPSQAGLGGGSSDAAAALVAGTRLWELFCPLERLERIGASLGSDVPFFVRAISDRRARAAVAAGRGDLVTPTPAAGGLTAVVVKPVEGLSTAAVYGACRPEDYAPSEGPNRTEAAAEALGRGRLGELARAMTNGLLAAALRLHPALQGLAAVFDGVGCATHQMSGSGSAYFGLFPTVAEGRRVAETLRALRVGKVFVTTIA